jgi:hypothetical protein
MTGVLPVKKFGAQRTEHLRDKIVKQKAEAVKIKIEKEMKQKSSFHRLQV